MCDCICPARLTVVDEELRHWGATWVMGSGEVCCAVRWDAGPRCGPVDLSPLSPSLSTKPQ